MHYEKEGGALIDLRKVTKIGIKNLKIGEKFVDEFGNTKVVDNKEIRKNGELFMSFREIK